MSVLLVIYVALLCLEMLLFCWSGVSHVTINTTVPISLINIAIMKMPDIKY